MARKRNGTSQLSGRLKRLWIRAQLRYDLTVEQIQMAIELDINLTNLRKLKPKRTARSGSSLGEQIQKRYKKRFNRPNPAKVSWILPTSPAVSEFSIDSPAAIFSFAIIEEALRDHARIGKGKGNLTIDATPSLERVIARFLKIYGKDVLSEQDIANLPSLCNFHHRMKRYRRIEKSRGEEPVLLNVQVLYKKIPAN